jgi:hypothetical protein
VDPKAHVLVKGMLQEKRIASVIPGVNIPGHLDENVKGSYLRDEPATPEEEQAVRRFTRSFYANLTPHYQWLRQWEVV